MQNLKLISPENFDNPLCAQVGGSFFYLDDKDDDTLNQENLNLSYNQAISICKNCEHIVECAEWGINKEVYGVWGGLTPYDRIQIRSKRKIKGI